MVEDESESCEKDSSLTSELMVPGAKIAILFLPPFMKELACIGKFIGNLLPSMNRFYFVLNQ